LSGVCPTQELEVDAAAKAPSTRQAGVVRIYPGTGRGVWRVEVPEADAAIASFRAVTPPSTVVVGQPVELSLRKVVTNHGPRRR
jgi:hypothetical protein